MYYILGYNVKDEKNDMRFNGEIYNKAQNDVDDVFIFSTGNVLEEDEIQAPFTIILDEKESSIKNKKQSDKISTSTAGASFLFLISPSVKALFEKLQLDNIQYFAVTVKGKNFELRDYKIVNITAKIDCVDFSSSILEMKKDQIRSLESLVLDESKIPVDMKIFLLGKRKTAIIIVHQDLKKAIEEAGLTGFNFVNLSDAGQLY